MYRLSIKIVIKKQEKSPTVTCVFRGDNRRGRRGGLLIASLLFFVTDEVTEQSLANRAFESGCHGSLLSICWWIVCTKSGLRPDLWIVHYLCISVNSK